MLEKELKQLKHDEVDNAKQQFSISIIAHNINRPANVGSLFRLADALGVEQIYLTGTTLVPPNRKINKTSRSTEKYVPFQYVSNPIEVVKRLQLEGYEIVSLEITNTSISVDEYCRKQHKKIALIIGSEIVGVEDELLKLSDAIIHIPMFGENSSLNVAMATGIAVYEIVKGMRS